MGGGANFPTICKIFRNLLRLFSILKPNNTKSDQKISVVQTILSPFTISKIFRIFCRIFWTTEKVFRKPKVMETFLGAFCSKTCTDIIWHLVAVSVNKLTTTMYPALLVPENFLIFVQISGKIFSSCSENFPPPPISFKSS